MKFRACSDEIRPCSFETARRLLWRNTNNELLPVYDRQLCECYLQPQILRCKCLGDNKWFLVSLSWAFPSNLSGELRFEWRTQIWVKPSGIPKIWVNPQISAITQNWGNHAQITQNWVFHLFLRVVIYLFMRRCKSPVIQCFVGFCFVITLNKLSNESRVDSDLKAMSPMQCHGKDIKRLNSGLSKFWKVFMLGNQIQKMVLLQWRHMCVTCLIFIATWAADFLLNSLFRLTNKTQKLLIIGLCEMNPLRTLRFSHHKGLVKGKVFPCHEWKQEAWRPNELRCNFNCRSRNRAFGAHHWKTLLSTPISTEHKNNAKPVENIWDSY